MARIPLPNLPGPIRTGDQSLVRLVAQPQAGHGGKELAAGMQQFSAGLEKLGQHVQQANDSAALNDFSIASNAQILDFEKWKEKEPDETQWVPEAEKRIQGLQQQFADRKLSPEGKLRMTAQVSDFQTRALMKVQLDSSKAAGTRAVTSAATAAQGAALRGDKEAISAAFANVPETLMPSYEKEAMQQKYDFQADSKIQEQSAMQADTFAKNGDFEGAELILKSDRTKAAFANDPAAYNRLQSSVAQERTIWDINDGILKNPEETQTKLQEQAEGKVQHFENASPTVLAQGIRLAQNQIQFNETSDKRTIVNDFASGLLHGGPKANRGVPFKPVDLKGDISAGWPESSKEAYARLSPMGKQEVNKFVALGPQNDPLEFTGMQAKIAALDVRNPLKVAQLETQIDLAADGSFAKELHSLIDERKSATKEADKTPRAEASFYSWLQDEAEAGTFGQYRIPGKWTTLDKKTGQVIDNITKMPILLSEEQRLEYVAGDDKKRAGMMLENVTDKARVADVVTKKKAEFERMDSKLPIEERIQKAKDNLHPELVKKATDTLNKFINPGGDGPSSPLVPALNSPAPFDLSTFLDAHGRPPAN